jgi:hypothetical protein
MFKKPRIPEVRRQRFQGFRVRAAPGDHLLELVEGFVSRGSVRLIHGLPVYSTQHRSPPAGFSAKAADSLPGTGAISHENQVTRPVLNSECREIPEGPFHLDPQE